MLSFSSLSEELSSVLVYSNTLVFKSKHAVNTNSHFYVYEFGIFSSTFFPCPYFFYSTLFPVDILYYSTFFLVSVFYIQCYFQSPFFTFRHFVPVGVVFGRFVYGRFLYRRQFLLRRFVGESKLLVGSHLEIRYLNFKKSIFSRHQEKKLRIK
jgi:hypothetical protein